MNLGALTAANHRGRPVLRLEGPVLALFGVVGVIAAQAVGLQSDLPQWTVVGASLLVFAAGLLDDLLPGNARGIRNHVRELASGRMTTGVLKVIVVAASAVVVVARLDRGGGWSRIGAVVLVAASANVWNGLDVRPGRALKAFVIALAPLIVVHDSLWLAATLWIGALVALPFDLRERAMLGDSGANVLGFVVGAEVAAVLPVGAIWPAAALAVVLNAVGETITFSRLIDAAPPLRWFDRLGRIPD